MTTRISGVFVPQVLSAQIAAEMDTRTSALIRSGAVVVDPFLAAAAGQNKGSKVTIPQYNSFTAADEVGNDDATDSLTTRARTSFEVDVPMLRRVINFSAMDLARAEANADPLGDLAVQAAEQILANQNAIVVSALAGVYADNDAAATLTPAEHVADDMITDLVGTAVTVGTGDTAKGRQIGRNHVITAVAQWGDFGNRAAAIVMHSAVYYGLLQRDTVSFRQESEQGFTNTYMGIPVILDDTMTTAKVGTSPNQETTYITALMAPGAVGFASLQGAPVLDRNERVGNGWGQETLIVRRTDLVNPRGLSFVGVTSSGVTDNNADNAVLDNAASWIRRWNRKNVGISFIKSFA